MPTPNLRTNPLPLPKSLLQRNLPKLDIENLPVQARAAPVVKSGPQQPKIVSSAYGPIKHLLLTYPAYADGEYSYQHVYADLFAKLPKHTRLTILSHPSVVGDLQKALEAAHADQRATIVEAPEDLEFTVWAEDPHVVVHDMAHEPPTIFLLEPYTFTRVGDAVIADLVADATKIQSTQSPLVFQGGNVLIGDHFILIGADYPADTLKLIKRYGQIRVPEGTDMDTWLAQEYIKTFDPSRQLFYASTSLPVPQESEQKITVDGEEWTEQMYVGTGSKQPIFHIDMFVSLTGRGASGKPRLMVGSPTLADQILGRAPVPYGMGEIFDDIAQNLEKEGFEVLRNPLPITYVDDPDNKVRMWYFATSNNCLVQISQGEHAVWLPTYGYGNWADLAATDAENKRLWENLGFQVHLLADFNPFAQNLGSIHCIKKYLDR